MRRFGSSNSSSSGALDDERYDRAQHHAYYDGYSSEYGVPPPRKRHISSNHYLNRAMAPLQEFSAQGGNYEQGVARLDDAGIDITDSRVMGVLANRIARDRAEKDARDEDVRRMAVMATTGVGLGFSFPGARNSQNTPYAPSLLSPGGVYPGTGNAEFSRKIGSGGFFSALSNRPEQDAAATFGVPMTFDIIPGIPPPAWIFSQPLAETGDAVSSFHFGEGRPIFAVRLHPDVGLISIKSRQAAANDRGERPNLAPNEKNLVDNTSALTRLEGQFYMSMESVNCYLASTAIASARDKRIINPFRTAADVMSLIRFIGILPPHDMEEAAKYNNALFRGKRYIKSLPVCTGGSYERVMNLWGAYPESRMTGAQLGFRVVKVPLVEPVLTSERAPGSGAVIEEKIFSWTLLPYATMDPRMTSPYLCGRMPRELDPKGREINDYPEIGRFIFAGTVELAYMGSWQLGKDEMARLFIPNPETPEKSMRSYLDELITRGIANDRVRVLVNMGGAGADCVAPMQTRVHTRQNRSKYVQRCMVDGRSLASRDMQPLFIPPYD